LNIIKKLEQLIGNYESKAKAIAEENEIKSQSNLQISRNKNEIESMKYHVELDSKKSMYEQEIIHLRKISELEVNKCVQASKTEIDKIEKMVKAIGKDTLIQLARAGPETQAKILGSLGVKSMLITDGKSPVNLFNTGNGLMGQLASQQPNN
jgi:major vault protein